jgi:hypothetical protein
MIRLNRSMIAVAIVAAGAGAVISTFVTEQTSGQTTRPARVAGKPNFSGIWQANNEAH